MREFCRGTIEKLDIKAEGGFDFGTTVVKGDDGHLYYIDFKNENLILRDEAGKTCLTAPEGIGLIDLDTLTPLTNADTKVGMRLLVTMTPAHPNWWDEEHQGLHLLAARARARRHEGRPGALLIGGKEETTWAYWLSWNPKRYSATLKPSAASPTARGIPAP
ncbi:MAG: hypothetical protein ACLTSG_11930 [Lachnospiraceae bacterium]